MKMMKEFFYRLKKYFKKKKICRKKLLFFSIASFLCLLILYYLISFFSVSKESMCLERLKLSFENEKSCHEDCALKRVENKNCLLKSLKEKPEIQDSIISYIRQEEIDSNFRIFLVDVIRSVFSPNNPPSDLVDCLNDDSFNKEVRLAIFRSFDWASEEKNPVDYYVSIIKNESLVDIRLESAVKIASYRGKDELFSLNQLSDIESVIMNKETNNYLRQTLVLLLGDYREYFKEESEELLRLIYSSDFEDDKISIAFAADLLGESVPEVSQEEWNSYYNQ